MSRSFRFRLDAALQQRARQEQALQISLARAELEHAAGLAAVERLRLQLIAEQRATSSPGSSFDVEGRMHLLVHVDRSQRHLQQQQRFVQQQAQELQNLRQQLIHASARRKALERLREHQKAEYDRDLQRRLDQELDEHGTLRYARPGAERSDANAALTGY